MGSLMKIKAVLFDLDDTLLWDARCVEEAFAATCAYAQKRAGVEPAQLEAAVREEARALYASYETFPFTQNIGINPFEGLWGHFRDGHLEQFRKMAAIVPSYRRESWTRGLKVLGIDDGDLGYELGEMFAAERRKRSYVYEETYEVLDALKGKYPLLLLTNGSPELQREKLSAEPQLAAYFDHILISGEFGEGKPAASLFRHAANRLGIAPEEGMMVGDKLTTDILGSNSVGMPNAWINRHGMKRTDDIVPMYEIQNLRELPGIIAAHR